MSESAPPPPPDDVPAAPEAPGLEIAPTAEGCPLWKLVVPLLISRLRFPEPSLCPLRVDIAIKARDVATNATSLVYSRVMKSRRGGPVVLTGLQDKATLEVTVEVPEPFEQWGCPVKSVQVVKGQTKELALELVPAKAPDVADPIADNALDNGVTKGRPYWFNYFWNEALRDRERAGLVSAAVFTPQLALKPAVLQWSNDQWRRAMKVLLDIGFSLVDDLEVAKYQMTAAAASLESIRKASGLKRYLVYRSDTRSVDALRARGFERQTVQPRAGQLNASMAWNPFSAIGEAVYVRRRAIDNCLYSNVSVSTEPSSGTEFPKLTDGALYNQVGGLDFPSGRWTAEQKAARAQAMTMDAERPVSFDDFALVTAEGAIQIHTLPVTTTNLYLMGLKSDDTLFQTQLFQRENRGGLRHLGGQEGFPERGLHSVPFDRFLAVVRFIRIHHNRNGTEGLTYFFDHATELVDPKSLNRADFDAQIVKLRAPAVFSPDNSQPQRERWMYSLGPIAPVASVGAPSRVKAAWPSKIRVPIRLQGIAKKWVSGWLGCGLRVYGRFLGNDENSHIGFDAERMDGDDVLVVTGTTYQAAPAANAFQRTVAFFRKPAW
jgi:hypothetical protein